MKVFCNVWYVPLIALAIIVSNPLLADEPVKLRLVAGDFPPFTFENRPSAPGALSELVTTLAARVGTPATIEFFPWQRAKVMPTKLHHVAVLPLTRIPEREHDYVWLVELYHQEFMWISRGEAHLTLDTFDAARDLRIGVLHGSASADMLRSRNFRKVVEGMTHLDLWRMLNAGLVDAILGGNEVENYRLRELGLNPKDYRFGKTLDYSPIWLAGSSDFTPQEVAQWTHALEAMKQDGSYAQIMAKYGLQQ
ncbi:MAG: transporter substrate-binding domain-containing protein [Burkholderiales bacterium]|nr:transporter substrate-binding domain-containing protein [Burkholderiales bacterium]